MRSLEVKIIRRSFASNISDGLVNLAFKRGFSSHKATGDGPDTIVPWDYASYVSLHSLAHFEGFCWLQAALGMLRQFLH